jgi:hypothetical protein
MIYPCACGIFLHVFRNIVMAFQVPLLGNTNPSDDVKKRQQAFLAPLLGMDLKTPYLVIAFGNANSELIANPNHLVRSLDMCVRSRATHGDLPVAGSFADGFALTSAMVVSKLTLEP